MGDLVSDRFRSRLTGGSQFFLHIDSYRYSICVVSDSTVEISVTLALNET